MDQIKYKVILLAFDGALLKNVVERVNSQRPVEVYYYTELKDFLDACIEQQPDLVGVSVSYPHARVAKFPRIFKMALNLPILTFGENQEVKTRKALSASTGDLKIQGVITAHNLWMKIVNFQKIQEQEEEKAKNSGADDDVKINSVFLKNKPAISGEDKGSILNNLFSALNETNNPKDVKPTSHVSSDSSQSESSTNTMNQEDQSSTTGKVSGFSHIAGEKEKKKTQLSSSNVDDNRKVSDLNSLLENEFEGEKSRPSDFQGVIAGGSNTPSTKTTKNQKLNSIDLNKDSNQREEKLGNFGKVQLMDSKKVQEDVEKKSKEKAQRDQAKQKNVLEVASETALEKTFKAPRSQEIRRFSSQKIIVFTVNMGNLKGYLLVTNDSINSFFDKISEFKANVIRSIKDQEAYGDLSEPYLVDIEVPNYIASIAEFAEFNINHQTSEGVCFNAAFVQREVMLPTLNDSDKEDMYFVDIKVIPPQTPVNFDAFLYLPRNKRFVRYLKEGRSLSLKQAKRHSEEEEGQNQLYVPKDQKHQFEAFFIKNTLNWEFELHKSNEVA